MSTTSIYIDGDEIAKKINEPAERPVLRREFDLAIEPGAGRTLDVRIVPYGVPTDVSDGGPVYREEWVDGCFDSQLVAGHRLDVLLNFEHQMGIGGIVGKGVALRSQPDGLHGSFEVLDGPDGDKALRLVNDGILRGISLEAYAKKSVRTAEGIVRRVKAHLDKVAICRRPAYKDAVVLAVREEVIFDEELLPVAMDPKLLLSLQEARVALPQRFKAHPAETDTPAETGTSEDGTRQSVTTPTSEERNEHHAE